MNTRPLTHRGMTYFVSFAVAEAEIYDWMNDKEIQELADDIRDHKQKFPIQRLSDGRIVDGRNRELACRIAGVEPTYEYVVIAEVDLAEHVESLNAHRRHLSAAFLEERRRARVERVVSARAEGNSLRAIAAVEKVSVSQVVKDVRALGVHRCTPDPKMIKGRDNKLHPPRKKDKQAKPNLLSPPKSNAVEKVEVPSASTKNRPKAEPEEMKAARNVVRRFRLALSKIVLADTPGGRLLLVVLVGKGIVQIQEDADTPMGTKRAIVTRSLGNIVWLNDLVAAIDDAASKGAT